MILQTAFEQFIHSGLYLRNWSAKTPLIYRRAFTSFQQSLPGRSANDQADTAHVPGEFSKTQLEAWVIGLRQRGLSPAGINIYIRAMNSFSSWLKENDHITQTVKLKQFKAHAKPVTTFSEAEIKAMMASKPKRLTYQRTWILIVLMLDTGCRIDEVLNLKKNGIDFDNLLITVDGKGSKVRRIPFSPEMRKHLWLYVKRVPTDYLFGTRTGTRLMYNNARRSIRHCFNAIGVRGPHVHPHNLRHTFACNYIKQGGNIFTLSRLLGHSSVTTTQTYLRGLQVEDLKHYSPVAP